MGLEYMYTDGEKACAKGPLKVKLDGRLCGEIRAVKDGFQYYANGAKTGETIFTTVPGVQNSLIFQQPSKADREVDVEIETPQDQSAAMIKKAKKELKQTNKELVAAKILLEACFDLFRKQSDSEDVLNLLTETVVVGETETDGHSIYEDITKLLEGE